ncbi:MAG: urease accessory protein [Panacagrimonas sp.]
MISILLLGLLLGMKHAIEADHVAALATLATRSQSLAQTVKLGAVWGLGHTLTLLLFGSLVLALDLVMPERLAQALEFAVGIMLVLLGLDVLRRIAGERVHFHIHRHAESIVHLHAHSHAGDTAPHNPEHHEHGHPRALRLRALLVGMMHGMAGSAALILLTLETVVSPGVGLLYIALFGLGSILGMALLSVVIAIPLRYSESGLTLAHNTLKTLVGLATVALGGAMIYEIGAVQGFIL